MVAGFVSFAIGRNQIVFIVIRSVGIVGARIVWFDSIGVVILVSLCAGFECDFSVCELDCFL